MQLNQFAGNDKISIRQHSPAALLNEIDTAIDYLRQNIGDLEGRLSDVLQDHPPQSPVPGGVADETMSPIAGDLLRKLRQINGLSDMVSMLRNRIDL